MVLKLKVSMAFIDEPVGGKGAFGDYSIGKLTTNAADYPDLPHTIADLTVVNTALKNAVAAAISGGTTEEAALRTAERAWNEKFHDTASYVNYLAKGDEDLIVNAGFKTTKAESTPAQVPGDCENFEVAAPMSKGRVDVDVKSVHGAAAYVYLAVQGQGPTPVEVQLVNNQIVMNIMGTRVVVLVDTHHKAHFDTLNSSQVAHVWAAAVNRAGTGPLTDPKEVTPQ